MTQSEGRMILGIDPSLRNTGVVWYDVRGTKRIVEGRGTIVTAGGPDEQALADIHCVGFDLDPDHVRIAVERLKYRFESTADPQADPRQVSLWDEE